MYFLPTVAPTSWYKLLLEGWIPFQFPGVGERPYGSWSATLPVSTQPDKPLDSLWFSWFEIAAVQSSVVEKSLLSTVRKFAAIVHFDGSEYDPDNADEKSLLSKVIKLLSGSRKKGV